MSFNDINRKISNLNFIIKYCEQIFFSAHYLLGIQCEIDEMKMNIKELQTNMEAIQHQICQLERQRDTPTVLNKLFNLKLSLSHLTIEILTSKEMLRHKAQTLVELFQLFDSNNNN